MHISYDPGKNRKNIRERELDFELVTELYWSSVWVYEDTRNEYSESRYIASALLGNRLHIVCFSETEEGMRVISFRKANKREVKRYEQRAAD